MSRISSKELVGQIITSLLHLYSENEAKSMAYRCLDLGWDCSATDILMEKPVEIPDEWDAKLGRLHSGEPLQYVMGFEFFRDRKLMVSPDALIPRPETEELVIKILPLIKKQHRGLDVGTGSGCIAVTLSIETDAAIFAWDVSEGALEIAKKNASHLGAQVEFQHQDIFEWEQTTDTWDFIVSNPPYVLDQEKNEMSSNVLDFEPHLALFVPDQDPLKFYQTLGTFAWSRLNPGGRLAVEINRVYGLETEKLFRQIGFSTTELHQDFNGNDRFVLAQK
jgi:release factor glutamine methyltransferase